MEQDTRLSLDRTDLERKLLLMKNNSILTDVSLMCSDRTLTVHKCILANSSLFFKIIFMDNVEGKDVTLDMGQLGVDCHHLETVIDYMYTGTISLNLDNIADVILLADHLVMTDLSDLAYKYIGLVLNEENCLTLYLSLYNHDLHLDVSKDIVACIWETLELVFFNFIIVQELFLQISIDHLSHLLSKGLRRNFNLQNVLRFLVNWIQQRNDENMMEIVKQLTALCREIYQDKDESHYGQLQLLDQILHEILSTCQQKQEANIEPDSFNSILSNIDHLQALVDAGQLSNTSNVKDEPTDSGKASAVDETRVEKSQQDGCEQDFTVLKIKTSHSSTVHPSTEDVGFKKGTKSLSSSLDKIKSKALEKSVQERVTSFLQGQMINTQMINTQIDQMGFHTGRPESQENGQIATGSNTPNSKRKINCSPKKNGESTLMTVINSIAKRRKIKPTYKAELYDLENEEADMNEYFDADMEASDVDVEVVEENEDTDIEDYENLDTTADVQDEENEQSFNDDSGEIGDISGHEGEANRSNRRSLRMKISCVNDEKKKVMELLKDKKMDLMETVDADMIELLKSTKYENYTCFICDFAFSRPFHFVRHLERKHRNAVMICEKCGEPFQDPKLYVAHCRTHLTDVEEMLTSVREQDGKKMYSCRICLKEIPKVSSIKAHLIYHRTTYTKTDQTETNQSKEIASVLKSSESLISKPSINQCSICSKIFKRRDHLSRHILCVHSDKCPFTCELCGKGFKVRYRYHEHLQLHTNKLLSSAGVDVKDEKSVLCYICGATMKSQKYLKKHLDTHLNKEKRHTCTVCHKSYAQAMTLQVHMRKHTGDKPFQCEICSMLFAVKSNLLRHQRRHRGEKRYKCDQCGKGFLMVGDLKRHYTTHTGEKNYACRYCGKKFNCKSKVPQHERIHTGEKPYACIYCGKRFIQNGDRKRHEATHTGHKKEDKARRLTLYEMANFTEPTSEPDSVIKYRHEVNITDIQWTGEEKINDEYVPMNGKNDFVQDNMNNEYKPVNLKEEKSFVQENVQNNFVQENLNTEYVPMNLNVHNNFVQEEN